MSTTETGTLSAESVNVNEMLGERGKRYMTPDFQRPYEWADSQLNDFWRDIHRAATNNYQHYIGNIILVEQNQSYKIIDGQQRITTISILLCALREYYRSRGDDNFIQQVDGLLSANSVDDAQKIRRLVLLNEENDDRDYEAIYKNNPENASGKVRSAYDFFTEKISQEDHESVEELRKTVLTGLDITKTEASTLSYAYQVFQTENDRGLDLDRIHILKSLVLEQAANEHETDVANIKERWLDVVSRLDKLSQKGAIRPIAYITSLSDYETPDVMRPHELVDNFEDIIHRQLTVRGEGVGDLLSMLEEQADLYIKANATESEEATSPWNAEITQKAQQFRYKNSHGALLLYYLHKKQTNSQKTKNVLDLATTLNVRLNLAETSSRDRQRTMHQIVKHTNQGENVFDVLRRLIQNKTPSDSALEELLTSRKFKQNKITALVLLELEREHFSNNHDGLTVDGFQIEHIAPQKAFSKEKFTPWRSKFDHDEDRFNNYKKRLGNLTPLASSQNQRAGSKPFAEKCREYHTSEFIMTQKLADEYDDWSYDAIEERTAELASLVIDTWSISA